MDLGPALHQNGFADVALMHYDFNIHQVEQYVHTILGDPDAAKYVAGTAYHWYFNRFFKNNITIYQDIVNRYPSKFLLNTEACIIPFNRSTDPGKWANFNEYADDIIQVLNNGVNGWLHWNLVLNMDGGPSWGHTITDAPILVSDSGLEYYKLPLYYLMGHFSKFLVPNSVRLGARTKVQIPGHDLKLTVFERPDNSTVLTVVNKNFSPVNLEVHDPVRGYLYVKLLPSSFYSLIWY